MPREADTGTTSACDYAVPKAKEMKAALYLWIVTITMGMIMIKPLYGLVCLDVGILYFLWFRRWPVRRYGGMNGNLYGRCQRNMEMITLLTLAVLTAFIR